jgi:O-acetyl-ADP-ribose deacetylase
VEYRLGNTILLLKRGDITEEDTDAIINAANSHLQHGGGVAGSISRKGGPIIQEESNRIGHVEVGHAAITSGGKLKARKVIHAVGPRMGEGDEDEKLRNATVNSLRLAEKEKLYRIAFPAISTGIFGYPVDRCAQIMLSAIRDYCTHNTEIREVRFCLFDDAVLQIFTDTASRMKL